LPPQAVRASGTINAATSVKETRDMRLSSLRDARAAPGGRPLGDGRKCLSMRIDRQRGVVTAIVSSP
jgi:hypothetical protein